MLGWINEAQRAIYAKDKSVGTVIANVALAVGTKQTLPTGGDLLLDSPRNLADAGGAPGRALRKVSMRVMDAQAPGWHTETGATTILEYMYDERTPDTFYVYPPAASGARLELKYNRPPPAVATTAADISVPDEYSPAVLDYILFRAFAKETEVSLRDRAVLHKQAFDAAVSDSEDTSDSAEGNDK